ncbi:MAG: hypothetical protein WC731_02810 [Candidatus Omnitrophota bacterium]|jgi:hypothetical protein
MEKGKLEKQFLKYCPKCNEYFPTPWKVCPTCKKTLRSFFWRYYLVEIFKTAIGLFKKILSPIVILLVCAFGTYGIQVNERSQYTNGFNLLINKKFQAGWEEIRGALTKNPLYKYVKSKIEGTKGKNLEIKKEQYALQDIYFDANNKRNSVLINNKVVFEGDTMGDFRIIKVNVDSVDIEINGKQENVRFGKTWN